MAVLYLLSIANKETELEKQLKEEEKILESVAEKKALMGVAELAKGIEYTDPIKTGYVHLYMYVPEQCYGLSTLLIRL